MDDNKPTAVGTSIRSADDALALGSVLKQLAWPLLMTYSLLPAAWLFPVVDSTREPYFDLTTGFATANYWVAQSGGKTGVPIIGVLMLVLLVTRHGISGARRTLEIALVLIIVTICAAGGAALNEHGVKPALKVPRPNIVYLAGANGTGPLGMSPQAFYDKNSKEARRERMRKTLKAESLPVELGPEVREHWIEETGYSLPSGHSFSSMFFATFFLATGISYISTQRLWLFYLLLPWALMVCYSRPILRVHTPTDIALGGLEGLVFGFIAFIFFRVSLMAWYGRFS